MMEFEELRTWVGNELKRRFWEHRSMPALSRHRVRIDGWLKVELTAILAERGDVEPAFKLPKGRAAARVQGWLVEVASLPTDFPFEGARAAGGGLADEVRDLRKLVKRLRKGKGRDQAAVFFAVYPFGDLHDAQWAVHKAKIEKTFGAPLSEDRFSFQGGVTGRLYAGAVQAKAKPLPAAKAAEAEAAVKRPAGRSRRLSVSA